MHFPTTFRRLVTFAFAFAILSLFVAPADAGVIGRLLFPHRNRPTRAQHCGAMSYQSRTVTTTRAAYYSAPAASPCQGGYCPAPARAVPQAAVTPATTGDPLAWVNSARASRGLHALIYDPNLSAWAAQNDAIQNGRGLGHFALAPGSSQIAAGTSDPAYAVRLWAASPPHAQIMFSRVATRAGISHSGRFATANIR